LIIEDKCKPPEKSIPRSIIINRVFLCTVQEAKYDSRIFFTHETGAI
jgi:hypothetical protein